MNKLSNEMKRSGINAVTLSIVTDNEEAVVNVEMPEDTWVMLYHYLDGCMIEAGLKNR